MSNTTFKALAVRVIGGLSAATLAVVTDERIGPGGVNAEQDIADLVSGVETPEQFRAMCLDAADSESQRAAWNEYADAVIAATAAYAKPQTNWRKVRFHLTSDKLAVVEPHPQAISKFAMEQGTIVMRFEPNTTLEFRERAVRALNDAAFVAPDVWAHVAERRARLEVAA